MKAWIFSVLLICSAVLNLSIGAHSAERSVGTDFAVGILDRGYPTCMADDCRTTWVLWNEDFLHKEVLKGEPIPDSKEGLLIWVDGIRSDDGFEVDGYIALNSYTFGDLWEETVGYVRRNFFCLVDGDRLRGKLTQEWSGEHNEVTLKFRFDSTNETPATSLELRFNGRSGELIGQTLPKQDPCQVRFW